MEIELCMGTTRAVVTTDGGYIMSLVDSNGYIFYPLRKLKDLSGVEKKRGGCHVCVPNFGPGDSKGLAQHGYGRIGEWSIVEQSENYVEMSMNGVDDYKTMDATLRYEVLDGMFEMSLTVENFGDSDLKVAPGFHPYFFVGKNSVEIDDEGYDSLDDLAQTKFVDGEKHTLLVGDRTIRLHSSELTTWALWTDQLGEYVCVEPTFSGNVFADDITNADTIKPNEKKTYTCTIVW